MLGFGNGLGCGHVGSVRTRTARRCSTRNLRMVISTERASIPSFVSSVQPSTTSPVVEEGWCFGEQSVVDAIEAVRKGGMVVVTDNADRENEGDLIMAGEKITTEDMAFMVKHSSGVICASIDEETANRLQLPPMVPSNTDPKETAFTVSIDYKYGTTTGISAADRALTVRALADSSARAEDFYRPGHIFPLKSKERGVLKREGHTEASIDLARMAHCVPVGVLVEIVDHRDGSMARRPYLEVFAEQHGLVMTSVADMIQYRKKHEKYVYRHGKESARLPTTHGVFDTYAYMSRLDDTEHLALVKGDIADKENVLVRVEVENVVGHVFGASKEHSRETLESALERIQAEDEGILIYLRKSATGRGQIASELFSPKEEMDVSLSRTASQILSDLKVSSIRVLSTDSLAAERLSEFGQNVTELVN